MSQVTEKLKHTIKVTPQKKLILVLLAAGQSRRFNGIKLAQPMLDLNADNNLISQSLLLHSLDKLNYLAAYLTSKNIDNSVVVVLGAYHDQLKKLLPASTRYVINHQSEHGLSTSVRVAVEAALSTEASDLLLALGDHIGVSYTDYMNLVDLWLIQQDNVCSSYQSQLGVPAIFGEGQFFALKQLTGDQGAKPLLHQLELDNSLYCLALPNAVSDIDTRSDVLQWQQLKLNSLL